MQDRWGSLVYIKGNVMSTDQGDGSKVESKWRCRKEKNKNKTDPSLLTDVMNMFGLLPDLRYIFFLQGKFLKMFTRTLDFFYQTRLGSRTYFVTTVVV